MQQVLNSAQQEDFIESIIKMTLDNFSMTRLLTDFLIKHGGSTVPLTTATIHLRSQKHSASISGNNCGFFLIPVVNMALLDCRRSLDFFGLTCDHKAGHIKSISSRNHADDVGIENFNLPRVKPEHFISVASKVISVPLEPIVIQAYYLTNKQLAHFTVAQPTITLQSIRDIAIAMTEAYQQFLFNGLGRAIPTINPTSS